MFNLNYLNEISGNNTDFVKSIIILFLKETPNLQVAIDDAIKQQNADVTKLHAHKLKSSLRALGAENIAAICADIEAAAKENNLFQADLLNAQLKPELEKLTKALRDYLSS